MLVYVHHKKKKKKRLDFFVSFYIGTVPAIGILFKDLNLLFKNMKAAKFY